MSILNTTAIPRRVLTVFLLLDHSGSMEGEKIAALNQAVRNVLPTIQEFSDSNPDAEIKVAALAFADSAHWITDEPRPLEDFFWDDLEADGMTALGEACEELSYKLSRNGGFMDAASGSYAPVIILLSDGVPTDDFEAGHEQLKNNAWYKHAIKIAISVGDDANKEVLSQFTKNKEGVFTVHNPEALKMMIRTAAITSSRIGSQSSSVTDKTKNEQVIEAISKEVEPSQGIDQGTGPSTGYDEWD